MMKLYQTNKIKIPNPLKNQNFVLLWIGETVSMLGDQFSIIALPWLVLQLTGSPLALGTVMALMSLPRAIFMLIGGVIVDKRSPRNVMIISNVARMILVGILTIFIFSGFINTYIIFAFAFFFGISDAFYYPAQNSLVPQILDEADLQAGNSLIQGIAQVTGLIGPALAGVIISIFSTIKTASIHTGIMGIGVAFLIDTFSFIATIYTSWKIQLKGDKQLQSEDKTILESIKEGAFYVWRNDLLRTLLFIVMVLNFLIVGPFTVGIPVLANTRLVGGANAYGTVTAVFAAGAIIGILLSGLLPQIKPKQFGTSIMFLISLQGFSLAVLPLLTSTFYVSILSFVIGILNGYVNIVAFTWLQKRIPKQLMGRILSLLMFASYGLSPLSSMASGIVLSVNMNALFFGAGIISAVFSLILSRHPIVIKMGVDDNRSLSR